MNVEPFHSACCCKDCKSVPHPMYSIWRLTWLWSIYWLSNTIQKKGQRLHLSAAFSKGASLYLKGVCLVHSRYISVPKVYILVQKLYLPSDSFCTFFPENNCKSSAWRFFYYWRTTYRFGTAQREWHDLNNNILFSSCCLEGTVPLIHNVCDGQSSTTVFHEHKLWC